MSNFLNNFSENNLEPGIKVVEYDVESDNKYKKNKNKKLLIEIIVVIIIICLISIGIIQFSKVEVPDFNNQLYSIVEKWGTNNKIQIIIKEEYSNDFLEDYVIKQSIEEGDRISKKTILTITVSKGSNPDEIIKVPDLSIMDGSQIKNWINENNLINTTIKEENSSTIPKSSLISYSFDSATVNNDNFKRSDILTIIISKGEIQYEKNIEVINLVSKTKDEVTKWCAESNLVCNFSEVISDNYEIGKITSQSIVTGEVISISSVVSFTVSAGEGIIVPNYSTVGSESANTLNSKLDTKIKMLYNMQVNYGTLISQSIKAGTRVLESDNKVELIYSLGKPYFNSLVGTSENALAKTFYDYNQLGVNFSYTVKYVNSELEKGSIVWSSKSNEFVTLKENIEIHVSNGIKGE